MYLLALRKSYLCLATTLFYIGPACSDSNNNLSLATSVEASDRAGAIDDAPSQPGSIEYANLFCYGDCRPQPCDIGLRATLHELGESYEIRTETITRDPDACADQISLNPRLYVVSPQGVKRGTHGELEYIGNLTADGTSLNETILLRDYRPSFFPAPGGSLWGVALNDNWYFARVVNMTARKHRAINQ